jgi:hypothetical protein
MYQLNELKQNADKLLPLIGEIAGNYGLDAKLFSCLNNPKDRSAGFL